MATRLDNAGLMTWKLIYLYFHSKTILKTEPEDVGDLDYNLDDEEFNPMEIDLPDATGTVFALPS